MSDRTAEIWSTRLQRELLALTHPPEEQDGNEGNNGKEKEKADDDSQATQKHDNVNIAALPPFVHVKDHKMDISAGVCKVTFLVDVDPPKSAPTPKSTSTEVPSSNKEQQNDKGQNGKEQTEQEPKPADQDQKEESQGGEEQPTEEPTSEDNVSSDKPLFVLVTLDASMEDTNDANPVCYPFQKPRAILSEGASLFPTKSTIKHGDEIDLDCDWTPSLHLSDAILNVALKVRESIRRGEPFHPSPSSILLGGTTDDSENANTSAVASILTGKGLLPVIKKKPAPRTPRNPALVKVGDIIDLSERPYSTCAGMFSCKAIRRPEFVERAIQEAAAREEVQSARLVDDVEDENEITSGPGNLMRLQAGGIKKVSVAGFVGAGTFFKSIVQTTKAALEESFLMVTQDHIYELRSSKFAIDSATVTFISPIALLAKLKFRREESISLFFKQAPDDPLILMCPESAVAVQQIQSVLKMHGVKGKHTNAATQRSIQAALQLVALIKSKENGLAQDGSVERVNEIMDLYRQAAEKFETAGDARHEEVMSYMRKFLAKPLVGSILDGSYKPPTKATIVAVPPAEGNSNQDEDDDGLSKEVARLDSSGKVPASPAQGDNKDVDTSYEDIMKQSSDILNEVEKLGMDDDDDLDEFLSSAAGGNATTQDKDHDPVAELDAMLSAADKELNDIIDAK